MKNQKEGKIAMPCVRMKKRGCRVSVTGSRQVDNSWTGDFVIKYRARAGKLIWNTMKVSIVGEWKKDLEGNLLLEEWMVLAPRALRVLKEAVEDLTEDR